MPCHITPLKRLAEPISLKRLFKPTCNALPLVPPLESRSNRPMTFSFEYHLKALVYLHLQEYESGRELLQVLEEDEFAKE